VVWLVLQNPGSWFEGVDDVVEIDAARLHVVKTPLWRFLLHAGVG
jgi:hypothetical protein